jgi:hypothetical protein
VSTVLRLLFLIPIGFVLACGAAAFALLWPFLDIGWASFTDPLQTIQLAVGFTTMAAGIGWVALVPFLIFLVLSEALRLRSVLIHLLAGLAGGALAAHAGPAVGDMRLQTATIVAGLAFALTYWAVAGHRAGRARRPLPPSPLPSSPNPPSPIPVQPAKD